MKRRITEIDNHESCSWRSSSAEKVEVRIIWYKVVVMMVNLEKR